jgi:hypothetical protein
MLKKLIILLLIIIAFVIIKKPKEQAKPISVKKNFQFTGIDEKVEQNKIETYSSFQQRIYQTKNNDEIIVDRDVYLHLALDINKNITIVGKNNAKIYIENSIAGFFLSNKNMVVIKNLGIEINNSAIFARAALYTNCSLILDNVNISLYRKSSFVVKMDTFKMENSSVINRYKNDDGFESSLLDFEGANLLLLNNLFTFNQIETSNGILVNKVTKGIILGNVVLAKLQGLNAPLTIGNSKDILIGSNLIYDFLDHKNNLLVDEKNKNKDPRIIQETLNVLSGGFGLSIANSDHIYDSKIYNFFMNKTATFNRKTKNIEISKVNNVQLSVEDLKKILNKDAVLCKKMEKDPVILNTYLKNICK